LEVAVSQKALKYALETAFSHLESVARGFNNDGRALGSKLRTRSRSMPALMFDTGLLPTLTFLWAKAGDETYKKVYGLLEKEEQPQAKGELGGKEKRAPSLEELSYALYLYGVLKFLCHNGILSTDSVADPKSAIESLVRSGINNVMASLRLLEPYLVELKKLCEAAYEEEKE